MARSQGKHINNAKKNDEVTNEPSAARHSHVASNSDRRQAAAFDDQMQQNQDFSDRETSLFDAVSVADASQEDGQVSEAFTNDETQYLKFQLDDAQGLDATMLQSPVTWDENNQTFDGFYEGEGSFGYNLDVIGPNPDGLMPFPDEREEENPVEKKRRRRKALKVAGITLGSVVGVVVGIYLIGAAVFSLLFFPNTTAVGVDLSLKNSEDAQKLLQDKLSGHDFSLVGQGLRFNISANDVDIQLSDELVKSQMHQTVNPWAWPYEVFQTHDITDSFAVTIGSSNLADTLRAQADAVNVNATQPINATVAYNADEDTFKVVPEQYGTAIDVDRLIDFVSKEVVTLPDKIVLTDEIMVRPEITSDDPRLQNVIALANNYLKGASDFTFNGEVVTHLGPDEIGPMIAIDPELNVSLNEESLTSWVNSTAASTGTVGSKRTYTRPDGKNVTVEGGTYGWGVDTEALKTLVRDAVTNGTPNNTELPFATKAAKIVSGNEADWGARFIDVDLSEQHVRMYDDSGTLVWESDCVSGLDNARHRTPTGVYFIESNAGSTTLRGFEDDGSKYESYVRYWMPFKDNNWGLHDADWRSSFGGSIYTYNGSHGCVNLPVGKARELSNLVRVGDPVVVHY